MQKLLGVIVRCAVTNKIKSCQPRLSPRGHEHKDRFTGGMFQDGSVHRFVHSRHSRAIMFTRKSLHVYRHGDGPHGWPEIEYADVLDPQPVSEVSGVR